MLKEIKGNGRDILKNAFKSVFNDSNPFGNPFRKEIKRAMLLYPTNGYYLDAEQYNILITIGKSLGEKGYYISITESLSGFDNDERDEDPNHWYCGIETTYEEYCSIVLPLENAIYSENGKWGVIISHEYHGLLGSSNDILYKFKELYCNTDSDLLSFKNYWREQQNEKWYKELISLLLL